MSEQQSTGRESKSPSEVDRNSELFAQLVLQQTNMALMLLGKVAHPESGKTYKDIDSARLFIDQLEMLEAKTKGNLSKDESTLLKQSLMNLRLAFVDAVESSPEPEQKPQGATQSSSIQGTTQAGSAPAPDSAAMPPSQEEHPKKFSKKY